MKNSFWLIVWFIPMVAFSQEKATFSFSKKPVKKVLFSLEKIYNIRFSYADEVIGNQNITLYSKERTLKTTLVEIEKQTNLVFEQLNERYILVKKEIFTLNKTQQLSEIILTNYLTSGIVKNKKGIFKIKPKSLGILPGLIEPDILETLQQLPSVISPNETATGIIVRGGTTDQNRVIWDGINIYHNGHLFGMISPFNPAISQKISFHNKGTNPRFGERVSSVIDIKTNTNVATKLKANLDINGVSASVFTEIPLVKNKLSMQLSARRSFAEVWQSPTFTSLSNKVFQTTSINQIDNINTNFNFLDYNAKLNYKINDKQLLSLSTIFIENALNNTNFQTDNTVFLTDLLHVKNQGYALHLNSKWSDKVKQKTVLNFSKYSLKYNHIKEELLSTNTIEPRNQISDFDKRNVIFDTNFNTEFTVDTKQNSQLYFGYQYSFKDVSYAFLNTTDFILLLDYNQSKISTHSLYSNYSYKTPKKWFKNPIAMELGFRVNHYTSLKKTKFEPRFVAYKNIIKGLKLQITGEVKNQIISQIDETILSNLALENRLWRLANNTNSPIINSQQLSIGLLYQKNGWSFDLDHYQKNIKGATALSLGFLNPDGQTFRIGTHQVKGIDFYTKKSFGGFNTWLSYSFNDVKSKFEGLNDNKTFTSNSSIIHALSTSVSYKINGFQMALGWKWRTGKPYTKSIITNNEIQFDGINTERLPTYHRLDFSSTYTFQFSKNIKGLKGKVGLSVRNLYNQKNQLSKEYAGFNTINDPIIERNSYSLGFTPNFMFGVYW